MVVDPTDMSEVSIAQSTASEAPKKRKGVFKALPLPLSIRQKAVSSTEFVSYCDIFNIWAQSDVQECLASIYSSMPKMWKDLIQFYKSVESMPSMSADACTAELISMFQAINKIYKNLCTIAIQAFQALQNVDPQLHKLSAGMSSFAIEAPPAPAAVHAQSAAVAVPPAAADYSEEYASNYDFLDFEDGQVDGTAGYADDFHFGAQSAANNSAHRQTVTMDVTRSAYRSMAVFERSDSISNSMSEIRVQGKSSTSTYTHSSSSSTSTSHSAHVFTVDLNKKGAEQPHHPLFSKILASTAGPSVLEGQGALSESSQQFANLLSQRSKEELSKVLQLSMACICHQLCPETASSSESSFNATRYLGHVLKGNCDFMAVAREMAPSAALCDNSYEMHNSKNIALLAQQLLVSASTPHA